MLLLLYRFLCLVLFGKCVFILLFNFNVRVSLVFMVLLSLISFCFIVIIMLVVLIARVHVNIPVIVQMFVLSFSFVLLLYKYLCYSVIYIHCCLLTPLFIKSTENSKKENSTDLTYCLFTYFGMKKIIFVVIFFLYIMYVLNLMF